MTIKYRFVYSTGAGLRKMALAVPERHRSAVWGLDGFGTCRADGDGMDRL